MKEYIIWGKTNPQEDEKILLTRIKGNNITLYLWAVEAKIRLEKKYGCTECRIQEINLAYPESLNKFFAKTINV